MSAGRRPLSPGWRWGLRLLMVVIALNLLGYVLGRLLQSPGGRTSSAYATASDGLAAYAELLARSGHPVTTLRARIGDAHLDPAATLVVLDASSVTPRDARALAGFAAAGGRLVAGGSDPAWLRRVVRSLPRWTSAAPASARPPATRLPGVQVVATAGAGAWEQPGGLLAAGPGRALLVERQIGAGTVELLADASPLQNRLLASADNAVLGLDLAGAAHRPVAFAESAHGFGARTGLAALPRRWGWALAGLGLAALVWIAAHVRRFGPPEREARPLPPARREYVDAIATALERTHRPVEAAAPVRTAALERLDRLSAHRGESAARDLPRPVAASAAGLTDAELEALLDPRPEEASLLAAGSALAKLTGERG